MCMHLLILLFYFYFYMYLQGMTNTLARRPWLVLFQVGLVTNAISLAQRASHFKKKNCIYIYYLKNKTKKQQRGN